MNAGTELNLLIAEKVMQWKCELMDPLGIYAVGPGRYIRGKIPIVRGYPLYSYPAGEDFSPSTNIAHAFEVVDILRTSYERGVEILVNPGHIRVRIDYGEGGTVLADTVPLAICLAALKAMKYV